LTSSSRSHYRLTEIPVNLVGENIDITQKSTEAVLDTGKEAGQEVNAEETKNRLRSVLKVGRN
jgi:hypothetical protein